ncbi:MAG: PAS domain S-box protein [Lentisphaerae bacterium]|nr:PAS domain S-box protein [Lentisphaerota bacterium]
MTNDHYTVDWDHLQPLVMNQIQDAITITDLQGRIIYVNDAECRLIQRTREELLGASVFDYGEDQTRGSSQHNIIEQTLQQGSWRGEVVNYNSSGEELILDCRTQLVYDAQGNAVAMCGIATDITHRKRMEQTLLASENNLAITLNSIGDAVIATDNRGCVTRMNPVAERLTGWSLEEARGQPLRDIFRLCDVHTREPLNDPVASVLHTGELARLANNTLLLSRDGVARQIADSAAPIRDAQGQIIGAALVFRDVTDEYRMRQMLRESEARYKALFVSANDGILVADAETRRFRYANPAICRLLGYNADELIKLTLYDIHPPEIHKLVDDKFNYMLQQSHKIHDIPCRRKDGSIVYVDISGTPMILDGRPCNVGFFIDTTERKKAADKIRENHEQLLAIMDANPDPVYVADPETYEILHINRALLDAFGEPGSRKCYEHFHNLPSPCPFCTNQRIFGNNFGKDYIWEFHNSRSKRWYRCLDRGIVWPDGRKVRYEMAVDITALKRAEEALRESVENLSITLQSIGDGVIATDEGGRVVNMNYVAEKMCGWNLKEARGRVLDEVFCIVNADTGRAVENPVHRVLALGRVAGLANQTMLISRNGIRHQIADTAAPIKDKNGAVVGVVLVFSDVTEKYRAEKSLKESEERLKNHWLKRIPFCVSYIIAPRIICRSFVQCWGCRRHTAAVRK